MLLLVISCSSNIAIAKIQGGSCQVMKPKALAIQRQDLTLSLDKVNSSSVYINNSALDVIETMVFTPPYYEPGLKKLHFEERPFNQLDIIVDGRKIEYKTLSQNTNNTLANSSKNSRIKPATYYYWLQRFPPAAEVHIVHSFKPILRVFRNNVKFKYQNIKQSNNFLLNKLLKKKSMYSKQDLAAQKAEHDNQETARLGQSLDEAFPYISKFCPSKDDYKKLLATFTTAAPEKTLITRELQYQLVNNDNWSQPIENFTLRIEHPENMLVLSCWPSKFNQTSANTLMFAANNYTPTENIAVLFVQK